jgi:hypothetical protein
MSEPNPFDLLIAEIREVIRQELKSAQKPVKALHTTKEAAEILGVEESWLADKARKKKIPCRMLGHYRHFSQNDIDFIIDSSYVPVVQSNHDGQDEGQDDRQAVSADQTAALRIESISTGKAVGGNGNGVSEMGTGGTANIGASGALHETARKTTEGRKVKCL